METDFFQLELKNIIQTPHIVRNKSEVHCFKKNSNDVSLFQELEEIYSDLCSTVTDAVLQGAEVVSSRVNIIFIIFYLGSIKTSRVLVLKRDPCVSFIKFIIHP